MNSYFSGLARRTGLGKSQARSQKAAQGASSSAALDLSGIEEENTVEISPVKGSGKNDTYEVPATAHPKIENPLFNSSEGLDFGVADSGTHEVDRREHTNSGITGEEGFEPTTPGQGAVQMEDMQVPDFKISEPLKEQKESQIYQKVSLNTPGKDDLDQMSEAGSAVENKNPNPHFIVDEQVFHLNRFLEIEASGNSWDSRAVESGFQEPFENLKKKVSNPGQKDGAESQFDTVTVAEQGLREIETPQPRVDVHIGKVIVDVRQDPVVAAPKPQSSPSRWTRGEKLSFSRGNLSRHYLRGY